MVLVLLSTYAALGHVITVNSLGDDLSGVCPSTPTAKCTYRKALAAASAFTDHFAVQIILPYGRIVVDGAPIAQLIPGKDISITGSQEGRTILDGLGALQLLYTHPNVNVNVRASPRHFRQASQEYPLASASWAS